jgi:chromosome segregation ATPase
MGVVNGDAELDEGAAAVQAVFGALAENHEDQIRWSKKADDQLDEDIDELLVRVKDLRGQNGDLSARLRDKDHEVVYLRAQLTAARSDLNRLLKKVPKVEAESRNATVISLSCLVLTPLATELPNACVK